MNAAGSFEDWLHSHLPDSACVRGGTVHAIRSLDEDYAALTQATALLSRSDRGTLRVTGADRAPWLHNLTTNQIKSVEAGAGVYAFALNVQGRILFDLNVLVTPEAFLLDVDRRFLATARTHFDKYTVTEDVTVEDRSSQSVRLGLAGPSSTTLMSTFGVTNATAMAQLSQGVVIIAGHRVPFFRHDFAGPAGFELLVPAGQAEAVWSALTSSEAKAAAQPVGADALEVRRIEAGIPWPGFEIRDKYLPAETCQLERGVSYVKGCYLGQEVVERMRSRNVVARKLVGISLNGAHLPHAGAELHDAAGKTVGHVTSACRSIALKRVIAMGYAKTAASEPGTQLSVLGEGFADDGMVVSVPFIGGAR